MTTFVIVAVLFILIGFVLGFFLTSRAANKNQGHMKHCQDCRYFQEWKQYVAMHEDPEVMKDYISCFVEETSKEG